VAANSHSIFHLTLTHFPTHLHPFSPPDPLEQLTSRGNCLANCVSQMSNEICNASNGLTGYENHQPSMHQTRSEGNDKGLYIFGGLGSIWCLASAKKLPITFSFALQSLWKFLFNFYNTFCQEKQGNKRLNHYSEGIFKHLKELLYL